MYRLICPGTVEDKDLGHEPPEAVVTRAVLDHSGRSVKVHFDEKDLEALFGWE